MAALPVMSHLRDNVRSVPRENSKQKARTPGVSTVHPVHFSTQIEVCVQLVQPILTALSAVFHLLPVHVCQDILAPVHNHAPHAHQASIKRLWAKATVKIVHMASIKGSQHLRAAVVMHANPSQIL